MHTEFLPDNLKKRYQMGDTKMDLKRIKLDSIQIIWIGTRGRPSSTL
jgi:hypothetical protein